MEAKQGVYKGFSHLHTILFCPTPVKHQEVFGFLVFLPNFIKARASIYSLVAVALPYVTPMEQSKREA